MSKKSKSDETALVPVVIATEPVASPTLRQRAGRIGDHARASFQSGFDATRTAAGKTGAEMVKVGGRVSRSAGASASAAGKLGSAAVHAVADLNGDGRIDHEDFKIAKQAAGRAASAVSREAGELGKAVARHEVTKDAAAGAAVGALVALPIPFVGPVTGAAVGAAIGMARGVVGSNMIEDVVGQVAAGVRKSAGVKTTRRKKPTP